MARRRPSRPRGKRLASIAVIVVVVLAAAYAPTAYQRMTHPLEQAQAIARYSHEAGVDPYLVAAVINVESGFRADVVSSAGAVGLMQLLPSTAKPVARSVDIKGKVDAAALSEPETNIRLGTLYLAELVARYDGDTALALAAYNAGMSNADIWAAEWKRDHGRLTDTIDFPETAHYVDEVETQAAVYRRLYPGALAEPVQ